MFDWTEDELALASIVGAGRETDIIVAGSSSCGVTIEYAPAGGAGLLIQMQIAGQDVWLWSAERDWCAWLAPQLSVPDYANIPPDLREALGHWACAPLVALAEQAQLLPPTFVKAQTGDCPSAYACVLTLRRNDASLRLRVMGFPPRWLQTLAQGMKQTTGTPVCLPGITVALAAGCVRLTRGELACIEIGATVIFDLDASVENGEVLLVQMQPVAKISYLNEREWKVEDIFKDHGEEDAVGQEVVALAALDALKFTLVAEIGRLDMTIGELRNLQPGAILSGKCSFDGTVTLRVSGQALARGRLIRVGERLAVRIE